MAKAGTERACWPVVLRERAKWAVVVQMRERPEGTLAAGEIDVGLAILALATDIGAEDEERRRQATDALGWLCDRRGILPLLRALADAEPSVRHAAASALTCFDSLPGLTVTPLAKALSDAAAEVRATAATALGRCRSQAALAAVTAGLDDPARSVRMNAARALAELGSNGQRSELTVARLRLLLCDPDPHVAYEAFWGLCAQSGRPMAAHRATARRLPDAAEHDRRAA
jgi:HEAT repeat protein